MNKEYKKLFALFPLSHIIPGTNNKNQVLSKFPF